MLKGLVRVLRDTSKKYLVDKLVSKVLLKSRPEVLAAVEVLQLVKSLRKKNSKKNKKSK